MHHDHIIIFSDGHVILSSDFVPLQQDATLPIQESLQDITLLQKNADRSIWFASFNSKDRTLLPETMIAVSVRQSLERLPPLWLRSVLKAYGMWQWHLHKWCSHCGQKMSRQSAHFEMQCTHCEAITYPRISPSIIVLIERGDELLMARGPHFPTGVYGLIAGFVELGETFEEAVHREVAEEVGIRITDIRYMGSEPWPFPDMIMVAFRARYLEGTLSIDTTELEDAGFYHYEALPGRPSTSVSIARRLIDDFVAERRALSHTT